MRLKILDRYVLETFLASFAVFLTALLALFIAVDLVSKIENFAALTKEDVDPKKQRFREITTEGAVNSEEGPTSPASAVNIWMFMARYYALRIPLFLLYLLPTVALFAAMFTISRLSRTNELIPVVTSGISLRRLSVPFLAMALLAGFLVSSLEEYVLPSVSPQIAITEQTLRSEGEKFGVSALDAAGNHIYGNAYDTVSMTLAHVVVTLRDERGETQRRVVANLLRWDPDRGLWIAETGKIYEYEQGLRKTHRSPTGALVAEPIPIPTAGEALAMRLTPADLGRTSRLTPTFLTLTEAIRLSREFTDVPIYTLQLYGKFTFPLAGLLIELAGLPFILTASQRSFFKGLVLCLIVVAAYYLIYFVCLELGQQGSIPPIVAAFLPSGIFLLGGGVFFRGLKT